MVLFESEPRKNGTPLQNRCNSEDPTARCHPVNCVQAQQTNEQTLLFIHLYTLHTVCIHFCTFYTRTRCTYTNLYNKVHAYNLTLVWQCIHSQGACTHCRSLFKKALPKYVRYFSKRHVNLTKPMGWLQVVGSLKLHVSFAKEPYKRDYILQKRPINLRSVLIPATP